MRAIEEKIIRTLRGWNSKGPKYLTCRDCVEVLEGAKKYFLWNSLLFWNDADTYYFSGRGWQSNTTRSRLNLLLKNFVRAGIYQKDWSWFLDWNGQKYPIDSKNIFYIKGNKLYKKAGKGQGVEILPL